MGVFSQIVFMYCYCSICVPAVPEDSRWLVSVQLNCWYVFCFIITGTAVTGEGCVLPACIGNFVYSCIADNNFGCPAELQCSVL